MNLFNKCKRFIVGFITGLFGIPDDPDNEGLKAERIQFWRGYLDPAWIIEATGTALTRTIVCADAGAAADLAKTLAGELAQHGYVAGVLEAAGTTVNVRLTNASVGRLTERDYAAAALIDLVV